VSGAETEAEGDATDVEGLVGEGGEGGVSNTVNDEDLPAELEALVLAATTDQSDLPDLFGNPEVFGE